MIGKIEDGKFKRYDAGNGSTNIDTELSLESSNPVENRVITEKINEIDEQISTNASNIAELSNPNLLINPDFKINQREQNSYISENKVIYTIDRWALGWYMNCDVHNGYISVYSSTGETSTFVQFMENKIDENQVLTFSIKLLGEDVKSDTLSKDKTVSYIIGNTSIGFDYINSSFAIATNVTSDNPINIEWIKLEQGSIATPFVAPDPATELVKCQRYYKQYAEITLQTITNVTGVHLTSHFTEGSTMRILPTVTGTIHWIRKNGEAIEIPNVTDITCYKGYIDISIENALSMMMEYNISIKNLVLDAEIY